MKRGVECRRGHDEWIVYQDGKPRCNVCRRMQPARRAGRPRYDWLPVEPLVAFLAPYQLKSCLRAAEQQAYYRARQANRITADAADKIAVAFGKHPVEIYGSEWWEVSA